MKSAAYSKITVRLSQTEADLVKHAAAKSGATQNEFIRQALIAATYLHGGARKSDRERMDFLVKTVAFLWTGYLQQAEENHTQANVIETKRRAIEGLKKAGYIVPMPSEREAGND